ncbi:ABC transporter permease [Natronosalvus halobius]|uniref:ABC transporter permease n=1 Tax=Natronosalvus halobius TaxID=2953746 RepID=UPI00209CA594|nr:ABC transporter permease [Natronosalvus halobius]USZ73638.1 ABC transporter permease [Natronosalvus halobius]
MSGGLLTRNAPHDGWLRERLTEFRLYVQPLVFLLVVWWAVSGLELVPRQALPTPVNVGEALVTLITEQELLGAIGTTITRVGMAFSIAVVVGFCIGMAMSQFRVVEWFFDPIISISFPIPKVTLVPIYVLWFDFGTVSTVALAATSALFPVAIATYNGTKAVNRELIWSAQSMGLSRVKTAMKVVLPAALPDILNGVQISLFLSFVVVIVAEMVMAGSGLGRVLIESVRFFQTPNAIAVVVAIAVFGLLFDKLLRMVRARLLWWTE